jgi:hypothetical protein
MSLLEMSSQLLVLTQAHKWDEAAQLQEQRHSLAEKCFSTPVSDFESEEVARLIQQIQSVDRQTTLACEDERVKMSNDLDQMKYSNQAKLAYEQNAK